MKKIVSIVLAAATALSAASLLAGCGNDNYPVTVANYTIDKEPENVVVLDPSVADIMAYMDYERKFAGRSDAVNQSELKAAPSVGSDISPNFDKISELKADLVFAGENLNDESEKKLEQQGVKVITLQEPQTTSEIRTNYETIGKILSGKTAGSKLGKASYDKLVEELDRQKRDVEGLNGTGALKTVCYLYMDGGKLMKLNSGSFGNILMGYTNCVNISTEKSPTEDTASVVANANPNFIFYDDEATLKAIQENASLSKINAVKSNKMAQITMDEISRPGITAPKTLKKMIDFIYGGAAATPDQAATKPAATAPATKPAASQPATQPATKAATATPAATAPAASQTEQDLSGKYKIDLNGLALVKDDSSDDVKAMQTRLADLGYVKNDDDHVTGYYGDATETAVKAFQKKNGINQTGEADNATLVAMFKSTAKKA